MTSARYTATTAPCRYRISGLLGGLVLGLLLVSVPVSSTEPMTDAGTTRQVLRVGPGRELTRPSQAARIAKQGALIEIDPGVYEGDVAVWRQHGLTLRGTGGRVELRAAGKAAQGKAIWVIQGDSTEIENLEFSGARVPHHNGAAIRAEGAGLRIRNCRLHHNEMGLLTNNNPTSLVIIDDSEFDHNRTETSQHGKLGHNIYIGRIDHLILRNSYVHDSHVGHLVKTRAKRNTLYGNRIIDGDGDSSYLLDLAEGGRASVFGNQFVQGARARNRTAISFAAEAGDRSQGHTLSVSGNRFINLATWGVFVRNHSEVAVELEGNHFQGRVQPLQGKGRVLE